MLGIGLCDQVSEWRRGRVAGFDEFSQQVTVEPWPDSRAHPEMGPNHQVTPGNHHMPSLDFDGVA